MNVKEIRIFLCHASEDKSKVVEVYNALRGAGYRPWLDKKDLLPGQYWDVEIPKAIKVSNFMMIFFSTTSVAKRGYVQKEFKLALDTADEIPNDQMFLIPVRLDDCQIPNEFRRIHYVDLFETDGFDLVIKAIKVGMKQLGITKNISNQLLEKPQSPKQHEISTYRPKIPTSKHPLAKIAVWNLAGFGGIPDNRLRHQVDGIAMLDADVVALVEINPISALETLREGLKDKGFIYNSSILPQANDLHIGVLYRPGISALNPQLLPGSDLSDLRRRKAFVLDMRIENFVFLLIVAHLKSGRSAPDIAIRDEQAKVILNFIMDRVSKGEKEILLVGDFNMIPGQDVSNYHYLGGEVMNFLSSLDLREDFSCIMDSGRVVLLDGFALLRTMGGNYIRESLHVVQLHRIMDVGLERFRQKVSDHLPFIASFRTNRNLS
jgi:endonuclease/exonuclease/phosphatase family metal-dependent hydrolase